MTFGAVFLDERFGLRSCRSPMHDGEHAGAEKKHRGQDKNLPGTDHFVAAFFASAITELKAGLGWLSPLKRRGLPWARQEFASLAPQKVTIFTESRCLRKARKMPA